MSPLQLARRAIALGALGAVSALGGLGCGAEDSACPSSAEFDVGAVVAASADDVAAIFARSCSLGGCHLSGPGAGGLVLGRTTAAWRAALVNVPSQQSPETPLVAPGDPAGSWLVAKLSGALCDVVCDRSLGCGGPMPPGAPLSELERATIVAWIAAGAP